MIKTGKLVWRHVLIIELCQSQLMLFNTESTIYIKNHVVKVSPGGSLGARAGREASHPEAIDCLSIK